MGTRGRKSSAELATVSPDGIGLTRRPEPPSHLGDDAADIWRATVNSLPADWFSPGTLPLLEAFCGLSVSQQLTLRALQRAERSGGDFDAIAPDSAKPLWAALCRHSSEPGQLCQETLGILT
jgi:hypothetical protein